MGFVQEKTNLLRRHQIEDVSRNHSVDGKVFFNK